MRACLLLIFFYSTLCAQSNPFAIDFPATCDLTNEDYIEVQEQIRAVDVKPLLQKMYKKIEGADFTEYTDFSSRIKRGIKQILIDPKKGLYPQKELVQIGSGGDRCVVCYGTLNGKYPYYIRTLIEALKEQGFNGYCLYYIGGWPNPTGEEIKYAAVPYCFKIFAMVEAYQLGFNHVLWLDAACLPLRNIDPLFTLIKQRGALLNWSTPDPKRARLIFPETRTLLSWLTGTDVIHSTYINSIVMGFKMDSYLARAFVRQYYQYVRMGTPFLSCFPEEWVFTAIIGQTAFNKWTKKGPPRLVQGSATNTADSPEQIEEAYQQGAYFYHRHGR